MTNKTVDVKRKIISLVKKREAKEALKIFHKNFTNENPAELEFIKNFYVELNRLELYKETFDLLVQIAVWYPDNVEFQDIFENATQTYVSKLILQANNIKFERIEKENSLKESLKRADSLTRERMQVENDKQLRALNNKCKELYKLAVKYSPKNLTAYKGWLECCINDNETEEIAELEKKIEELSPSKLSPFNKVDQNQTEEVKKQKEVDVNDECEKLFQNKEYEELLKKIEENKDSDALLPKIFLLKARALVELKRFKEADKAIFEAEQSNTNYYELKQTKEDINAIKLNLYLKAGSYSLKNGIKLGYPLGKNNFIKAKFCFFKALQISPDDLNILDQAYSALKYLGEDEEAFKIKGTIYSIEKDFKTTYDSNYNQTLCFIATYAFYDQPDIINEFRWFRREYLLNNNLGRNINSLYVKISSRITKSIHNNHFLRYVFKIILYIPLLIIKLLKLFHNILR